MDRAYIRLNDTGFWDVFDWDGQQGCGQVPQTEPAFPIELCQDLPELPRQSQPPPDMRRHVRYGTTAALDNDGRRSAHVTDSEDQAFVELPPIGTPSPLDVEHKEMG